MEHNSRMVKQSEQTMKRARSRSISMNRRDGSLDSGRNASAARLSLRSRSDAFDANAEVDDANLELGILPRDPYDDAFGRKEGINDYEERATSKNDGPETDDAGLGDGVDADSNLDDVELMDQQMTEICNVQHDSASFHKRQPTPETYSEDTRSPAPSVESVDEDMLGDQEQASEKAAGIIERQTIAMEEKDNEIMMLKHEIDSLNEQLQNMREQANDLIKDARAVKQCQEESLTHLRLNNKQKKELEELRKTNDNLRQNMEGWKEDVRSMQRQRDEANIAASGFKTELANASQQLSKSQNKVERYRSYKARVRSTLVGSTTRLNAGIQAMSLSNLHEIDEDNSSQSSDSHPAVYPADAVAIPEMETRSKRLKLEKAQFPKRENFASFADYVKGVTNVVQRLLHAGYHDGDVADSLFQNIMATSKLAARISSKAAAQFANTTEGVLKLLRESDAAYCFQTAEDRFHDMAADKSEDLQEFMERVKSAYDAFVEQGTEHEANRSRKVKNQFLKGSTLPEHIRERLRPYTDLREMAHVAQKELMKIRTRAPTNNGNNNNNNGNNGMRTYNNNNNNTNAGTGMRTYWNRNQDQSQNRMPQVLPQHQQQQRQVQQMQQQQMQQGDQPVVLAAMPPSNPQVQVQNPQRSWTLPNGAVVFTPPMSERLHAPTGTERAPTGAEFAPETKANVCKRCRQVNDHPMQSCQYHKFCSYCQQEGGYNGHTDYEAQKCPARQQLPQMQHQA